MSASAPPRAAELVRALAGLGLTGTQARLYIALLRAGEATAAELANRSGTPRTKVYDALRTLESGGFCAVIAGRVNRYRAASPESALAGWVEHRDQQRAGQAEHDRALVASLLASLPRALQPPAADAPEYIEAVSGRVATSARLEAVIGRAQRTLAMMQQPPWLQPRSRWNRAEIAAARRDVSVRVIYSEQAVRDRERWEPLLDAGGEARVLARLPMKLCVRDGVEAFVSLRDAATGEQGLVSARVRHPDLAAPLALLFDKHWQEATPLRKGDR
ncbi:MAG: TrmB family transcriptional regulator [Solirubrobacteraceae bacterium]